MATAADLGGALGGTDDGLVLIDGDWVDSSRYLEEYMSG